MKIFNQSGIRRSRRLSIITLAAASLIATSAGVSAHSISGAIWTSQGSGEPVDHNIYPQKCDVLGVWLNGGPNNSTSSGLPEGDYIFQVTNPSGSQLLSTDAAKFRQVHVGANGRFSGVSGAGNHDVVSVGAGVVIELCEPDGTPFANTDNPGGEYKLWLTTVEDYVRDDVGNCDLDSDPYPNGPFQAPDLSVVEACGGKWGFVGGHIKTDNFKAPDSTPPPPPECTPETTFEEDAECYCLQHPDDEELCGGGEPPGFELSGMKCYDADTDGVCEGDLNDEPGIQNWVIDLFQWIDGSYVFLYDTTTDETGDYLFLDLDEGTYAVCEEFPLGPLSSTWIPTTPASIEGIDIGPNSTGNNFGNVCLGAGGGKTLGFWSNKNGQRTLNDGGTLAPELALLASLNLRKANGDDFNPGTYTAFRTWILNATATNMAYMLSAQLAAMELNVEAGFVNGGAFVYMLQAPYTSVPASCTVGGLQANGFISIGNLMNAANSSLGLWGLTLSGHDQRSCQEFMKNALDRANNNLNFVSDPQFCVVDYTGEESCAIE